MREPEIAVWKARLGRDVMIAESRARVVGLMTSHYRVQGTWSKLESTAHI
jgi:hypothetical protein